jgi:death-on-curing protein
MKKLKLDQIIKLHEMLLKETGGIPGLRDVSLLESAINSPFQTFDKVSLYPTLERKAARLGYGIVKNHPFLDGNKRIGLLAMLTFLEINGIELQYTDEELIKIGLALADGTFSEKQLLTWISFHS